MAIQKFTKQGYDLLDYDFDFTEFLDEVTDTISTATVSLEDGVDLVLTAYSIDPTSKKVKAWFSGGTEGTSYVATCRIVTAEGRHKESELLLRVKEVPAP